MTFQNETLIAAPAADRPSIVLRAFEALKRPAREKAQRRQFRREYLSLLQMSDVQLRDIGLTRAGVYALLYGKSDERDEAH